MFAVVIGGLHPALLANGDDFDSRASDAIRIGHLLSEPPLYFSKTRPAKPLLDNMPPKNELACNDSKGMAVSSADQRDTMRRRMDEWNRMPPQDRNRYQQRYQQWQQLRRKSAGGWKTIFSAGTTSLSGTRLDSAGASKTNAHSCGVLPQTHTFSSLTTARTAATILLPCADAGGLDQRARLSPCGSPGLFFSICSIGLYRIPIPKLLVRFF